MRGGVVGQNASPFFSFVVPAHNEAADIGETLRSLTGQTHEDFEIVVVDDGSTDETAAIVQSIDDRRVRLLGHAPTRGAGYARNVGMEDARGVVVIFVDADDSPPADFLARIRPYYDRGADAVAVDSSVPCIVSTIGRFAEAEHKTTYANQPLEKIGWTAGFSCRRRAGLVVRFPELPGCGGEDVLFAQRLVEKGFRLVGDRSLVVNRRVPTTFRGFLRQSQARGAPVPYVEVTVRQLPHRRMVFRRGIGASRTLIRSLLVIPNAYRAARYCRHSPRGKRDFFNFLGLIYVMSLATRVGEAKSLFTLLRETRSLT
jgi:glycosyltransferase involved in cell wall biosynthesis